MGLGKTVEIVSLVAADLETARQSKHTADAQLQNDMCDQADELFESSSHFSGCGGRTKKPVEPLIPSACTLIVAPDTLLQQ